MLKSYEIKRYLLLKIQKNDLSVGDKLPSESSLAIKFNCNRHTVREALHSMKNLNLIKNKKGAGNILIHSINHVSSMRYLILSDDLKIKKIESDDIPLSLINTFKGQPKYYLENYFFDSQIIGKSYIHFLSKAIKGEPTLRSSILTVLANNNICITEIQETANFIKNNDSTGIKGNNIAIIKQLFLDDQYKYVAEAVTLLNIENFSYKHIIKI